jgi:lipopolysaccharide export system protein LptA
VNSYAQNSEQIELINSDRIISSSEKHPDYWLYIGNVKFQHNGAIMKCDSSHHYKKENKMIAFGKISINKGDSLFMSGKKLVYNGNKSSAHLSGGVILKDKNTTLITSEITYNFKKNTSFYPKKGEIIDKETSVTSNKGSYNAISHNFYFKDNVRITGKDYTVETDTLIYNSETKKSFFLGPSFIYSKNNTIYCENGWYNTNTNLSQFRENAYITDSDYTIKGDSLFYDRNKGYGKAIDNICMIDTVNNIIINGNLAEYFEKEEYIEVTQNALLKIIFEKDTLFMTSNKFVSNNIKGKENIIAYNNVKIFKEDFQGKCDSLFYSLTDSVVNLYNNPVLWVDDMQITSDSINIKMYKQKIHRMYFYPNPIIISKADSLHYNQIKGKYMVGIFKENKLQKLNVVGNGQSLFLIEDDKKEKMGINKAICTDISINMLDSKLSNITYKIIPKSITTPFNEVKEEDKYLDGFIWRMDEKPKSKEDILN